MKKLFALLVMLAALVFASLAVASSLPQHRLCLPAGGGATVDSCNTVGAGTGYEGGFVFKGMALCNPTVSPNPCYGVNPPVNTSYSVILVANSNGTLTVGNGEHTNATLSVGGVSSWIQVGIMTGIACGVSTSTPVLYIETNTGNGATCGNGEVVTVVAAVSIGSGYRVSITYNGNNTWTGCVVGVYCRSQTYSGPVSTDLRFYGEDYDRDNLADEHNISAIDLQKNNGDTNWPYWFATPGGGPGPTTGNPFQQDWWPYASNPVGNAKTWLPALPSPSDSNAGITAGHTPAPITKDAPWIVPGFYKHGKLVKALPFQDWPHQ